MALDTTLTEGEAGHIAAHAALREGYVARGRSPSIGAYTSSSTPAEHLAIHIELHAEHNALGAATALPTSLALATIGHLAHHAALHAAYNSRQASAATAFFDTAVYGSATYG